MEHCVFCAGKKGQEKIIEVAIDTAKGLERAFDLEHDCIMQSYHSDIKIMDEGANMSIWMSNSNDNQLIKDCMTFAVWLHQNKERHGIKPKWAKK